MPWLWKTVSRHVAWHTGNGHEKVRKLKWEARICRKVAVQRDKNVFFKDASSMRIMITNILGALGLIVASFGLALLILPAIGNAEVLWPHWREPGYQKFFLWSAIKTVAVGFALCLIWLIFH